MHAAFAEVGVLYASGAVHEGWIDPPASGRIAWKQQPAMGYHAFAIVAYDGDGVWRQNSWGDAWGRKGFARISYDEWLEPGPHAGAARLAVAIRRPPAQAGGVRNRAHARPAVGPPQDHPP